MVAPFENELRPALHTMWGLINCCGLCPFEDEAVLNIVGRQDESVKGEFGVGNPAERPQLHNLGPLLGLTLVPQKH